MSTQELTAREAVNHPSTPPNGHGIKAVLATVPSDSHSWNLVFLQMLLEEHGVAVENLGPCTPVDVVAQAVIDHSPDLVVISTVNGHGGADAITLAQHLKTAGVQVPMVIGGKLGCGGPGDEKIPARLLDVGFAAVYTDTPVELDDLPAAGRRVAGHLPASPSSDLRSGIRSPLDFSSDLGVLLSLRAKEPR